MGWLTSEVFGKDVEVIPPASMFGICPGSCWYWILLPIGIKEFLYKAAEKKVDPD